MLTREETEWTLTLYKVLSILNVFPIEVNVKNGKIQRQSNPVKFFIWKILFGLGVSHWLYVFGRLVQTTILEPEKYFRWDHFVFHAAVTSAYGTFYFAAFHLFVKHGEDNVLVFNRLFLEREDPVQNMIEEELKGKVEKDLESANENGNKIQVLGRKCSVKSGTGTQLVTASASARQPHEEGHNQNQNQNKSRIIQEQSESESEFGSDVCPRLRPLLTWPPQYSLDELLARLVPFIIIPTAVIVLIIFAIDWTRPHLLFSSLPPEYQNPFSFVNLYAFEVLSVFIVFFTATFTVMTQVMFFSKCQSELEQMNRQLISLREKFQNRPLEARDTKREIWILRQILDEIKELVVFIELFNRCFPFCIFYWKLCSLSMVILFYFFAIRHSEDFPLLGVFAAYCAVLVTLVYAISYRHAFSIPGNIEDLKNEFLLTAQKTTSALPEISNPKSKSNPIGNPNSVENKNTSAILRAEMKKQIKRIPNLGVKVGSFHTMERESTPNFVDFVFNQVVDLLVTFPR